MTEGTSESTTRGTSEGSSVGESFTEGRSTTTRNVPLSRHREERHESPSLLYQVSDQLEAIKQVLHGLKVGEAMVKLRDRADAVLIQTAHVDEKWNSRDKFKAIDRMKEILKEKPYFSTPDLSPGGEVNRLIRFLDDVASERSSEMGQATGISGPQEKKDPFA